MIKIRFFVLVVIVILSAMLVQGGPCPATFTNAWLIDPIGSTFTPDQVYLQVHDIDKNTDLSTYNPNQIYINLDGSIQMQWGNVGDTDTGNCYSNNDTLRITGFMNLSGTIKPIHYFGVNHYDTLPLVANQPPSINGFHFVGQNMSSGAPFTDDVVGCQYEEGTYDDPYTPKLDDNMVNISDIQPASMTWNWYINDELLTNEHNTTLDLNISGNGDDGDTLRCELVLYDGLDNFTYESKDIEINSPAPRFTSSHVEDGVPPGTTINEGDPVTFSVTAIDPQSDKYRLLICDNIVDDGQCYGSHLLCSSNFVNSGTTASCLHDTANDPSERDWYAYVCDVNDDCAGPENANSPYYVNRKPTTYDDAPLYWVNSSVSITLFPQDPDNEVKFTKYSINHSSYKDYSVPLSFSSNGIHSLSYYSVDALGAVQSQKSVNISIDRTPPLTTATNIPEEYIDTPRIILLSAVDTLSGINKTFYSLNGSSPLSQGFAGTAINISSDGVYDIRFMSTDNAGNIESVKSIPVFHLDTKAPYTWDNYDGSWHDKNFQVRLNATDYGGSGVKNTYYCFSDSADCTPTSTGTIVNVTCKTNQVCRRFIRYNSVDNLGHAENITTVEVRIDHVSPTNVHLTDLPEYTDTSYVSLSWLQALDTYNFNLQSGVDSYYLYGRAASQSNYTLLDSYPEEYHIFSIIKSIPVTDEKYTVKLVVCDAAGNCAEDITSTTVDTESPVIVPVYPTGANKILPSDTFTYMINYTDTSPVDCLLSYDNYHDLPMDGDGKLSGTAALELSLPEGQHNFTVQCTDDIGHTSIDTISNVQVDLSPPVTTDNIDELWHNNTQLITLTSYDLASTVQQITYCVAENGSSCTPSITYTSPIALSCNTGDICSYIIRYHAIDSMGHIESVKNSSQILFDLAPPLASDSIDKSIITATSYTIVLNSSDGHGSGTQHIWYRLCEEACTDESFVDYTMPVHINEYRSYTLEYYAIDNAGNVQSAVSKTFELRKPSSGGGSSSSHHTSGGSSLTMGLSSQKHRKDFATVQAGQLYSMDISDNSFDIMKIAIVPRITTDDVSISVVQTEELPSDTQVPEHIYGTYELNLNNLSESDLNNAEIQFKVDKDWIWSNGYDINTIRMVRYHNGAWQDLVTTKDSERTDYVYYTSRTPGFSYFAILGSPAAMPVGAGEPGKEESSPLPQSKPQTESKSQEPLAQEKLKAPQPNLSDKINSSANISKEESGDSEPITEAPLDTNDKNSNTLLYVILGISLIILAGIVIYLELWEKQHRQAKKIMSNIGTDLATDTAAVSDLKDQSVTVQTKKYPTRDEPTSEKMKTDSKPSSTKDISAFGTKLPENQYNVQINEVINYVIQQKAKGIAIDTIREKLQNAGWPKAVIDDVFSKTK